jgi:ABC-type nitrate/sulfonate/bicarbonate transport system substrate-binding protein
MRQRKQSIFLLALFASVAFLSSSWAAEKVRFAITSRSVSSLPFFIALKEGFYQVEGMEVEFIHMGSQIAVTVTVAGSVEFSSTPGPAVDAAVRGVDIKVIFLVGQWPLLPLLHRETTWPERLV